MLVQVLIDKNSIEYEGSFDILTDNVPNRLEIECSSLEDLKDKVIIEVTENTLTDTPDWVELVIKDIDFEIMKTPILEFVFDVKALYKFNKIVERNVSEYLGVKLENFNETFKFNDVELQSYKLVEINECDKPKTIIPKLLETGLKQVLKEYEFLYDDATETLVEVKLAILGIYKEGTLYFYEGEKL